MKKVSYLWLIVALIVTCQPQTTHTFSLRRFTRPFHTASQRISAYIKPRLNRVKRFFGFKNKPLVDINKRYKAVKYLWYGSSIKAYFLQYCLWKMYCDNKEAMTKKAAEHALNGSLKRFTYPFVTSEALAQAIIKMDKQKLTQLWKKSPVSRKIIKWAFTAQLKSNLCQKKNKELNELDQTLISLD